MKPNRSRLKIWPNVLLFLSLLAAISLLGVVKVEALLPTFQSPPGSPTPTPPFQTLTPTPGPSYTPTPTETPWPTDTSTATWTPPPLVNFDTPIPGNTYTPTSTPTSTATPAPTNTLTNTSTPTDTPTPTDTATPTNTPTPMDTATSTPKPRDKSNASSLTSTPLPGITPLPSATPTPIGLPYLYDVESGPAGWQATGLWRISTRRSHSPNQAWWYGQETTGTYDAGPQAANSGDLTSPLIALPSGQELTLRFATRWQVETARPDRDLRLIQLQDASGTWQTIRQLNSSDGEEWRASAETIDLSAYAGQMVRVRFHFDTVDGEANAFEGWWVDDVAIEAGTPPSYLPVTGGVATP